MKSNTKVKSEINKIDVMITVSSIMFTFKIVKHDIKKLSNLVNYKNHYILIQVLDFLESYKKLFSIVTMI